jgi:hypothetical protein
MAKLAGISMAKIKAKSTKYCILESRTPANLRYELLSPLLSGSMQINNQTE